MSEFQRIVPCPLPRDRPQGPQPLHVRDAPAEKPRGAAGGVPRGHHPPHRGAPVRVPARGDVPGRGRGRMRRCHRARFRAWRACPCGYKCERDLDAMARGGAATPWARPAASPPSRWPRAATTPTFPSGSMDMNRIVGAELCEALPRQATVQHAATPTSRWASRWCRTRPTCTRAACRASGGLPVGSSGTVVGLLSSGIDSPVALWRMARRGAVCVRGAFLGTPPDVGRRASIWWTTSRGCWRGRAASRACTSVAVRRRASARYRFGAPPSLRVILYRRLMFKVAERIAARERAGALVTGESLGQVASQTLDNIRATDAAVELPVLRPLIGTDKLEIIAQAEELGTFEISSQDAPDCCTLFMPRKPGDAREAEGRAGCRRGASPCPLGGRTCRLGGGARLRLPGLPSAPPGVGFHFAPCSRRRPRGGTLPAPACPQPPFSAARVFCRRAGGAFSPAFADLPFAPLFCLPRFAFHVSEGWNPPSAAMRARGFPPNSPVMEFRRGNVVPSGDALPMRVVSDSGSNGRRRIAGCLAARIRLFAGARSNARRRSGDMEPSDCRRSAGSGPAMSRRFAESGPAASGRFAACGPPAWRQDPENPPQRRGGLPAVPLRKRCIPGAGAPKAWWARGAPRPRKRREPWVEGA